MIQNEQINIREFLKFTNGGLRTASFVQIRSALIKRYKEIYGNDIDVSTGSADGIFINDLSLIINNILQTVQTVYGNLDVNSASGVYLDRLCALSNIYRKPETNSTASIEVTNESTGTVSFDNLIFVDQSGTEWLYDRAIELTAGETRSIEVVCKTAGPVSAPAGWITQTIQSTYITVVQKTASVVGETEETDSELKARRSQSTGSEGTTVLESLIGSLLAVSGIRDVLIYNNDTDKPTTDSSFAGNKPKDGTTMTPHSVYVVLRRNANVSIPDETIGTLIYEKMTPGIKTNAAAVGTKKSYVYTPKVFGNQIIVAQDTCYWKEAVPIHPEISITIIPTNSFNVTSEKEEILNYLVSYLNGCEIGYDLTTSDMLVQASYADPQIAGRSSYIPSSVTITGATSGTYTNPDTYFNYDVTKCTITASGTNYVITLKGE